MHIMDMPVLLPLASCHPDFPFVSELYLEAFPPEERRDLAAWQSLADLHGFPFSCLGIYDGTKCLGFITIWAFDDFVYVEHFALHPDCRGGGWGSKTINRIAGQVEGKPIILEVEPPCDDITRRRVRFYERAGFHLCDRPYMQPPYRPTGCPFPLCLMATKLDFLIEHFEHVVTTLHREVYGVETPC